MADPQNTGLSIEDWRNLVLIGVAIIGLPLATWRSWIAHKQIRLSEAGQNLDRYQKSSAMLGDEKLPIRIAGVLALQDLAEIEPAFYSMKIQAVLVSFIKSRSRGPFANKGSTPNDRISVSYENEDLRVAIRTIGTCRTNFPIEDSRKISFVTNTANMTIEEKKLKYFMPTDMGDTNLKGADIQNFDWRYVNFMNADISNAVLCGVIFTT